MMYAVNVLSAGYLIVAMALSGEAVEALGFFQRHPYVTLNILAFGLASAVGQVRSLSHPPFSLSPFLSPFLQFKLVTNI